MYNFLINLLSRQSIPVCFRICINLVHFIRSNAFSQSIKQTHNFSSISKVRSDIYHSQHPNCIHSFFSSSFPNWSSPSTSSIFLSTPILSILAAIVAVYTMRQILRWPLHFVAYGFFNERFNQIVWPFSNFFYIVDRLFRSLILRMLPARMFRTFVNAFEVTTNSPLSWAQVGIYPAVSLAQI